MRPAGDGASETPLESLLRVATDEPGRRPEFYKKLLGSDILIACAKSGAAKPERASFAVLYTLEGLPVVPFFTSPRTLREAFPHARYVATLTAREFFECTRGQTLHLNPKSPFGRTFTPDEIESLLSTGTPVRATSVQESHELIGIAEPSREPAELISALTVLYSRMDTVEAAYLGELKDELPRARPRFLLALRMGRPDDEVIHATATVAHDLEVTKNFDLDLTVLDDTTAKHLAGYFASAKPFYDREWGARMIFTE